MADRAGSAAPVNVTMTDSKHGNIVMQLVRSELMGHASGPVPL
ncbi:hypothetical protein PF007_g22217 [Phytophthora fragariae]|nr:hypothetical protein PF007_g22217 [Phytophthora fragariae]